jgi:antitoxin YefM
MTMQIMNYTEARASFKALLDTVNDDHDVVVINRRDGADAVVMGLAHYQSLMETLHLTASPTNNAQLAKSIAQDRAGKAKQRQLIAD